MSYRCSKASSLLPRQEKVSIAACQPWSVCCLPCLVSWAVGQAEELAACTPQSSTGEAPKSQEDPLHQPCTLLRCVCSSHGDHLLTLVSSWTAASQTLPAGTMLPAGLCKVQTSPRGLWNGTGHQQEARGGGCREVKQCVRLAICHPTGG